MKNSDLLFLFLNKIKNFKNTRKGIVKNPFFWYNKIVKLYGVKK